MKKILSLVLALMLLAVPVFANPDHEHKLMHMRNDASHYDECTICFELFNVGDHTMKDGVCTVCNYPETAPWEEETADHEHELMHMRNDASHYDECTICFELFNVGDHTMKDGVCTVCNYPETAPWEEEIRGEGEHEHILMNGADIACHYEECQVCFVIFNVEDHTFANGKCTVCGYTGFVNPFIDVLPDAWYHDEVVKAVESGIINGKSATEFKPDDNLTYAEAIKLAACMNQLYTEGKVTLVNGDPWYQTYLEYCLDNEIITTEFFSKISRPDEYATRAGYMEIFANALPDSAFKEINNIPDGSILDVKDNAPYVYKMYRAGIVTGVDAEHRCNPDANILRCEVATIISRMMDEDKRVRFDMVNPDAPGIIEDNVKVDPDIHPSIVVGPEKDDQKFDVITGDYVLNPLTIYKQPEGLEAESYGIKVELEVQLYGGKAPYSYKWFYYTGNRNETAELANGDYIKDVTSDALVVSVEKENTYLGRGIYCVITDAEGESVQTNTVKVYGPFSMPADSVTIEEATKKYTVAGQIADGIIRAGDKISVERNGKIIATGTASELQMFGKSLDEGVKGDRIGIVFTLEKGVAPKSGDTVIKYKDTHVIDTSDIIN